MLELVPGPELITVIETQQLHEQKPDVARARQYKRARQSTGYLVLKTEFQR
jgi:hypothetical protein